MKNNLSIIVTVCFISFLSSCLSDEAEDIIDQINDGPGTITATINGVNFNSGGRLSEARLEFTNQNAQYSLRIDAEEEKDGFEEDLDLNLFGGDFSLLEVGDTFRGDGNNGNPNDLIFSGNYSKIGRTQGDNTDIQTATQSVSGDVCTITKLDRENRLVSGTFSYDAVDIFDGVTVYEVRNGVFTDLRY